MFTLNNILMNTGTNVIIGVVIFILLWLIFYFVPIGLWFTALLSGVRINLLQLILMRWRKVPPKVIVNSMITATKAGLQLTRDQLEAHYLAGGRVNSVVKALISADKANIPLDFKSAAAIDLAGRNVLEAVQVSVNPKVIETPKIAAVAKDGIEVIVIARVTVRANIERLVGGAGEETIIARVGEGIVTTVGSSDTHKSSARKILIVLSYTDSTKGGWMQGLHIEILSIDIADVDVG